MMSMHTEQPLDGWARYAIYAVPSPDSELGRLGAEWLEPRSARPSFAALNLSAQAMDALTATPSRYRLHGTLKAPFQIAQGRTVRELDDALSSFAASRAPAQGGVLRVEVAEHGADGFVALRFDARPPEFNARAQQIVAEFDMFRLPMSAAERERRRPDRLEPRAVELLDRWGYPWVEELFQFHLTLTGRLSAAECHALAERLSSLFEAATRHPYHLEDIALVGDPGDGGRFELLRRYPFVG